jgi:hypothetical protein
MPNATKSNAIMQSVIIQCCVTEFPYADYRVTECHYAEYSYAKSRCR